MMRNKEKDSLQNAEKNYRLKRRVDLFSGIALIVGTMIGTSLSRYNK